MKTIILLDFMAAIYLKEVAFLRLWFYIGDTMEDHNTYSNAVIMNLFILHGQCDKIIGRTSRKFYEMYPVLPQINIKKFILILNNLIDFVSILKSPRN